MSRNASVRAAIADAMAALRATPHWFDRVAAGAIHIPLEWCTPEERDRIDARAQQIAYLRRLRAERRIVEPPPRCFFRDFVWRGINMTARCDRDRRSVKYRVTDSSDFYCDTPRQAARAWLCRRVRHYGHYGLRRRPAAEWVLSLGRESEVVWTFDHARPARAEIARVIRRDRIQRRARLIDPHAPDTLGWRAWRWSSHWHHDVLVSPHQGTPWFGPDLRVEEWVEDEALRGVAGIHARRMPRDWRRAAWCDSSMQEGPPATSGLVTGVVERYGRYVLGRTGWRAEWVVIRALQAPTLAIQDALMRAYPDIPVYLSPYCAAEAAKEVDHENR